MQDSNLTCIYQMLNSAPHIVVGAGFHIAVLTTQSCLPSVAFVNKFNLGSSKPQEGYYILVF